MARRRAAGSGSSSRAPRWKAGQVVALRVKGELWTLAQLLREPYLALFRTFVPADQLDGAQPAPRDLLFTCAVTASLLRLSAAVPHAAAPVPGLEVPRRRIAAFVGTRQRVVWPGTAHERRFFTLEAESGGRLLERDPDAPASAGTGTLVRELSPADFAATAGIELDTLWAFPLLNERLFLIHTLGRAVDPLKELRFDRPMPRAYQTFVDILASHGSPDAWGYPSAR